MLYAPPFPQWYCAPDRRFEHNWIHLPPAEILPLARLYGVPENTVVYPARTEFIPRILAAIQREQHRAEIHAQRAMQLLAEELLLLLGRHLHDLSPAELTAREAERLESFRDLRARMHERLTESWTVEAMAARVHLSPSRFAALYKRFFAVSPVEDLIQARLERARWLLTNSTLTVSEVAAQSGFDNIYYFSRSFRRRVGCPPREYYRRFVVPR